MGKSAKYLGQQIGLTAQEMNYALREAGFLSGESGDYTVTEKGKLFAKSTENHRGNGGYSTYNRYWIERTWDESVIDELNINNEQRKHIIESVATECRLKREAIKVAQATIENPVSPEYTNTEDINNDSISIKEVIILGGIIIFITITGYTIYKAVPYIKNWWLTKAYPTVKSFSRKNKQNKYHTPAEKRGENEYTHKSGSANGD